MSTAAGARLPTADEHVPDCVAGDVTIVAHDIGPVRGMERQLSGLVVGLERLGYKITVVARVCELPEGTDVTFRRVRGPSRPFLIAYPWFMLAGSLALRRWRRGVVQATGAIVFNHVDVIAVHYCHQVAAPTPSRATWVYRLHVKLAGALKRFGEQVCFRINRAATFVCVSEGLSDELREHFPALAERVLTIHNGIDTADFTAGRRGREDEAEALRSALAIGEGRLVAAFVASEWERKGLAAVIQALALAPEWDLVVAGGGDRPHYQSLAESLGVGDSVHWLGVVRDVDVVYEMADAFVLPTSYESFSLVSFEAAASGLPVLVTPVHGVRELIVDGQSGFFITRDPSSIATRLGQLTADPDLRRRLGEAARDAAQSFDTSRMVAEHHELYLRLDRASGERTLLAGTG
ncbi:MAG TPA: glycosyltransferase family 4 protein [Solirubrobacteraceae bacterium]|jgi:glycosyltransferase involved in cell wall biosynthesis|nr:glycosyltransferase family 4 protein [Solirubrobacteraceae bacterium]